MTKNYIRLVVLPPAVFQTFKSIKLKYLSDFKKVTAASKIGKSLSQKPIFVNVSFLWPYRHLWGPTLAASCLWRQTPASGCRPGQTSSHGPHQCDPSDSAAAFLQRAPVHWHGSMIDPRFNALKWLHNWNNESSNSFLCNNPVWGHTGHLLFRVYS